MNAMPPASARQPALPVSQQQGTEQQPSFNGMARPQMIAGIITAVLFFVVLGGWAATAPLVHGATATGTVSPDSSRRVIQHLEGGIIRELHVEEGQSVREGDLLVTLDPIRAEANFSARQKSWLRLLVQSARLDAQATGLDKIRLPDELSIVSSADLDEFVGTQINLFDTRRTTLEQQEAILGRQVEQLEREIDSISAEIGGLKVQQALIGEEIADKASLLESQLINKSEVLDLRREQAVIESDIASRQAQIARIGHSIEETRLTLLQTREQFRDQVAEEATRINNDIAAIEQEMIASNDVLQRTQLYSPVDGTVLDIRNQTIGGVVRPGDPVLDIVPVNDELIILARLSPRDINLVHAGLVANVNLVPFQSRNALPLRGEVTQVAADTTYDEQSGESYYELRVLVPAEELAKQKDVYLTPGMPADVVVVTNERTMLQYLFDPVTRTLRTAFVYD